MSDGRKTGPAKDDSKAAAAKKRKAALGAALRANLKRRKAQARARADDTKS